MTVRRGVEPFSEKGFYLSEFRGRTLGIAVRAEDLRQPEPLEALLKELEGNQTRVLLLTTAPEDLDRLTGGVAVATASPRFEVGVWRAFSRSPRVGVRVPADDGFARTCREVARRLGLSKLMWVDPEGGVHGADGRQRSFVDLEELRRLRRDGTVPENPRRRLLLGEVEAVLEAGVAAVNLSTLAGLADELFTYAGSGTLFTRERYVDVRRLGLDDFDAAHHLVARGVEEGYLAPRPPEEVERVLASGFGAFVAGHHLAGIGALLEHREAEAAEIASLYTLTRFVGEGVGAHLVRFAVEQARDRGFAFVFACTTAEPVVSFFARCGFARVGQEAVPDGKWRDYDAARRARVHCVQLRVR